MRRKAVSQRLRSVAEVRATLAAHGDRLGDQLEARRPPASSGGLLFSYRACFDHMEAELVSVAQGLMTAEDEHVRQQVRLVQLRRRADELFSELYQKLVALRRILAGLYGADRGFELAAAAGRTPANPRRLAEQAEQTVQLLRHPEGSAPPRKIGGVTVDFAAVADELHAAQVELRGVRSELERARKTADRTRMLTVRRQTVIVVVYAGGARGRPRETMKTNTAVLEQLPLFEPPSPTSPDRGVGIERGFSVPFVARLALKEKQIQQNYRPIIAVHKWFARRPGSLFRALLLSEFAAPPLRESYFRSHDLAGLHIADPFMGGGTPLVEANRLGCDVTGWDINPMAWWIVRQEIRHLDLDAYHRAATRIGARLKERLGRLYLTRCELCGSKEADVKYFLWVKRCTCSDCGKDFDLFPGYLLAGHGRHPMDVLICHSCGQLNEVGDRQEPGGCVDCGAQLVARGPARRSHCECPHCAAVNTYVDPDSGPPQHRMFAIEYHCWSCKPTHRGRFFKRPDPVDKRRYSEAIRKSQEYASRFVPDDEIPRGDETNRLHRWGYRKYREMFNDRQLLGLEHLCREIAECCDSRVRHALATNLSDLLRYQNMLCRYDTSALKSLDIFSVHGFPVGLVQCESNILGIRNPRTGSNVGSGGWSNIVDKFTRAKRYCDDPFEFTYRQGRKVIIPTAGEWIGESREDVHGQRSVRLYCDSATRAKLPRNSLDAVLTDPPYFANVQYAELMDFCYVWLRRLVGKETQAFIEGTTRNGDELTGNATMERDLAHFTAGLSKVFQRMTAALKPGAPFAFTYHHNQISAYFPVAVAILDAGLICTASLPCPAEMGGSIHIHSTDSSIIDTVFVCRTTGGIPRPPLAEDVCQIADLINREIVELTRGEVNVSRGDARCIAYGHLIRLTIWRLKASWNKKAPWPDKLGLVEQAIASIGGYEALEERIVRDVPANLLASRDLVKLAAKSAY